MQSESPLMEVMLRNGSLYCIIIKL